MTVKTHCLRGHEFTPENTYVTSRGTRQCRICCAERAARYRGNHPDRVRQTYESRQEQLVTYRRANRDRQAAYMRGWYEKNKGRRDQYRADNRAKFREYQYRRRAALRAAVNPELLEAKIAYWGWRCWICGAPWEQVDHVKPLSAGGPHLLANLRPACKDCNQRKNDRWPYAKVG